MAQYRYEVQIAWHAVEQLANEWGARPYFWEREVDIQSELRSRLQTIYSLLGYGEVITTEPDPKDRGRVFTYRYARACCEPSIKYEYSDKKVYRAKPDIVVWDDLPNPAQEPDDWPILWACEIKYMNKDPSEWDVEKLGYLIDQERIKFGCWLTLDCNDSLSKPEINWDQRAHGAKLWVLTVMAPSSLQST
jgi:hypothetical protein